MLSSVRIIGFLIIAPPFSHNAIPAQVKVIISLGLALAVAPRAAAGFVPLETGPFLGALVIELLSGAALGFLVYLAFAAVQSAGSMIDLFSGFQMAQAFDPQSMVNGAQFTRLMQVMALALLFASDAYQLIIGGLVRSFDAIPLGAGISSEITAELVMNGLSQMFLAAIQIAGPLIVVLFLADAGLGLLTRVAPQLNAFALGFPLKILITLSMASMVLIALPRIISVLVDNAVRTVIGVG